LIVNLTIFEEHKGFHVAPRVERSLRKPGIAETARRRKAYGASDPASADRRVMDNAGDRGRAREPGLVPTVAPAPAPAPAQCNISGTWMMRKLSIELNKPCNPIPQTKQSYDLQQPQSAPCCNPTLHADDLLDQVNQVMEVAKTIAPGEENIIGESGGFQLQIQQVNGEEPVVKPSGKPFVVR
jgi:hypothetical protein